MTFDELIRSLCLERIDMVKMSVEGAELSVPKGVRDSLCNELVRKQIIEIHKTQQIVQMTPLNSKKGMP